MIVDEKKTKRARVRHEAGVKLLRRLFRWNSTVAAYMNLPRPKRRTRSERRRANRHQARLRRQTLAQVGEVGKRTGLVIPMGDERPSDPPPLRRDQRRELERVSTRMLEEEWGRDWHARRRPATQ